MNPGNSKLKSKLIRVIATGVFLLIYGLPFLTAQDTLPSEGLLRLQRAYPAQGWKVSGNHLIWKDSTVMVFDDGLFKTEQLLFDSTDLEDQLFALPYSPGICADTPGYGCNPGTYRCAAFFKKMYGSTEAEVRKNLTTLWWPSAKGGQKLVVTKVNNVHLHLRAVADELATKPHLKKYITGIGGGFNWRNISGTQRPSPHSYGIAIDINTRHSHYWQWDYPAYADVAVETNLRWRNSIPWEIVEIFEKHGFIWGGKWYHYDTMHFEYRPELLIK